MKKISIIALLLSVAVLMQYCKKSDDTTTDSGTAVLFQAYVNGTLWTPTKTTPVLTYNATTKTKTFVFTADSTSDRIMMSLKLSATKVDSGFAIKTYIADTGATANATTNILAYYKLANGVTTSVGSMKTGYVIVSAIDSVKKLITGTFGFTQTKLAYDGNGKLTTITNTAISSGEFNNLPYTFKKQ